MFSDDPCSQTVPDHRVSNHHRTEVHLRIYQTLKLTSYLTNGGTVGLMSDRSNLFVDISLPNHDTRCARANW
jgi:hypothetical protein